MVWSSGVARYSQWEQEFSILMYPIVITSISANGYVMSNVNILITIFLNIFF